MFLPTAPISNSAFLIALPTLGVSSVTSVKFRVPTAFFAEAIPSIRSLPLKITPLIS